MHKWIRRASVTVLVLSLTSAAACSATNQNQAQSNNSPSAKSIGNAGQVNDSKQSRMESSAGGMQALGTDNAVVPITTIGNAGYVPIRQLSNVLQFDSNWDAANQTMQLGDKDPAYEFHMNSTSALKDGDPVTLPAAPLVHGNTPYLPIADIGDLFRDEMSYNIQGNQLIIYPSNANIPDSVDTNAPGSDDPAMDFAEDPNDPFKGSVPIPAGEEAAPTASMGFLASDIGAPEAVEAAARNIDINGLIRNSMRYLGVKYQFGAAPYPQSKRFDCSTFTQYMFGKYGIHLPRTARQQARVGTTVSRKNLRKGDLLFFYVPGRFKSNRTVGHVGIYIGGMNMINADKLPRKNGVQIININRPYWKRVYLFAKRIAY